MLITLVELKRYFNLDDEFVTITSDGTWATVTQPNHGFKNGDYVEFGESTNFNNTFLVMKLNVNSYKFKSNVTATDEIAVVKKHDFILNAILESSHSFIQNYTGLEYGNISSQSEIHDLNIDGIINVKRGYVNAVSEVKLSLSQDFTDAENYISLDVAKDIFVYNELVKLKLDKVSSYIPSLKSVKITYTCQTAPAAIKFAALQLCEFHYRNHNDKNINVINESTGATQKQVSYQKNIPQTILDSLEPFKRYTIGF